MVQSAKDRIRDNVSESLDRTSAGRVLLEQNVRYCDRRVLRGLAYNFAPWHLRSAARGEVAAQDAVVTGVRVARSFSAKR
jgi:formylglycine-generating enzyme required for sulfatase activity